MTVTGVFCARVRVEEKQIIGAFGDAGAVAMPVLPANAPMPPGPATHRVSPDAAVDGTIDINDPNLTTIIDRCQNRYVAEATMPLLRARGVRVIDAGIAGCGTRLQVASALAEAGLPRPATLVGFSEDSANQAVRQIGVPSSLFSLKAEHGWTPMLDDDTAEAVIEHRMVLGSDAEAVVLIQAGAPAETDVSMIHVIDGRAIAIEGAAENAEAIALAERTARTLRASIIAIQIVVLNRTMVIWDVLPVADFRGAQLLDAITIGESIAALTLSGRELEPISQACTAWNAEVRHGVSGIALTA